MPKRKNKMISGGMPGIDSYRSKKDKPKIYEEVSVGIITCAPPHPTHPRRRPAPKPTTVAVACRTSTLWRGIIDCECYCDCSKSHLQHTVGPPLGLTPQWYTWPGFKHQIISRLLITEWETPTEGYLVPVSVVFARMHFGRKKSLLANLGWTFLPLVKEAS